VPWPSTRGERERARVRVGWPSLARPGRDGQAKGERERSAGVSGPRARVWLGRAREEEREAVRVLVFVFLFQKYE
jgi:hypothetical protein